MTRKCPDIKSYFIQEAPCILKQNICPGIGYANGSQGKLVGIVPQRGYNLPTGAPGELIMIEPPEYLIMEVHHDDGEKKWTTTISCKRHASTLEYGKMKNKKNQKKKYHCMSTEINLTFSMTIHETQGQTLKRAILLLGRQRGLSIGKISWALLYVALSRTKKLSHLRFFPSSGGIKDFIHLTKLKPSSIFTKWSESYRNHRWNPDHLRNKHQVSRKAVENELKLQGRGKTLKQSNVVLRGYLSRLGFSKLGSALRPELVARLRNYMEDKNLWEHPKVNCPPSKRVNRNSSKPLNAPIKRRRIDKGKSSLIGKAPDKIPQVDVLNASTGKNKKKTVYQKKVSSKNRKKQKKKHKIPWLRQTQFKLFEIGEDGNCLFRSISHQLYGTQECHRIIRKRCCDYLELEKEYFERYVANVEGNLTFSHYIRLMRKDGEWGGNMELIALTELYRRTIKVYHSGPQPDHVFGNTYSIDEKEEPIHLHYRGRNHYESLLTENASEYFEANEAGLIEGNNLSQYRKIKLAEKKSNKENEEKDDFNIEELNLQQAIQESLKLQKIEQERAEIRRSFQEELKRAISISMMAVQGSSDE